MAVMDVVWALGEAPSADVVVAVQQRRALAATTIRTVLANLRKKGYVAPVPTIGRGLRWKAIVTRESVARRSFGELLRHLFAGSPKQAIAFLLDDQDLSAADVAEIRQLLDAKKPKRSKS
jgi:predicted transcriptional regulator